MGGFLFLVVGAKMRTSGQVAKQRLVRAAGERRNRKIAGSTMSKREQVRRSSSVNECPAG